MLKIFWNLETDLLPGLWMHKCQVSGMKVQSVGCCTIKVISHYRGIKPQLMSSMHAQLMGSPGMWPKMDPGHSLGPFNYFPGGNAFFSGIKAHQLPWPVK